MTRSQIATVLYKMRKEGSTIEIIDGEIYSVDELLTMLTGHIISEDAGFNFIQPHEKLSI